MPSAQVDRLVEGNLVMHSHPVGDVTGLTSHDAVTLGTNTATALSLSGQELSLGDKFVQIGGDTMTGKLTPSGGMTTPFSVILTVDPAGKADYTTIGAACSYVSGQSPSATNRFLIEVLPGTYTENIVIPQYTAVRARSAGSVVINGASSSSNPDYEYAIVWMDSYSTLQDISITNITNLRKTDNVSGIVMSSSTVTKAGHIVSGCTLNLQNAGDASASGTLNGIYIIASTAPIITNTGLYIRGDYRNSYALNFSYGYGPTISGCSITEISYSAGTKSAIYTSGGAPHMTINNTIISGNSKAIDVSVGGSATLVFSRVTSGTLAGTITEHPHVDLTPSYSARNTVQPTTATVIPLTLKGASSQSANLLELQNSSGTPLAFVTPLGGAVFNDGGGDTDFRVESDNYDALFIDASNDATVVMNNASGKIAFFGATPVTKQTELTDELTTITHTAPGTPDYAVQDLTDIGGFGFTTKDEGNSVLAVVANLQTRVKELEDKLVAYGLLVDAD